MYALGATRPFIVTLFRRIAPWLALLVPLVVVFGRTHLKQWQFAAAADHLCDDVRIVNYYFLSYADPALFANDVLGRYHAEGTSELYRLLYMLVAKIGVWDGFTRFAPFVLFGVYLVGIGVAAKAVGGPVAAFVSIALCVGSPIMLARMAGVLPRAFAFPILAWMAAALVTGRIRAMAVLTILGAGFYPVLTVIGLLALSVVAFALPEDDRGSVRGWSIRRRAVLLLVTGATCALLTVPFALRMSAYGHTIASNDLTMFPEAGPGGRHDLATAPPYATLPEAWEKAARTAMRGAGPAIWSSLRSPLLRDKELEVTTREWLAYLTVTGATLIGLRRGVAVRRLACLAAAIGIGYLIALSVAPRLVVPERYVLYGVPVLVVLLVSTFVLGFLPAAWSRATSRGVSHPALCLLGSGVVILGLFGGRGEFRAGLGQFVMDADKPLYRFVARLPTDILVAGWPQGTMDTLSYASHRTPFLSRELHVPYHTEMTLLMRKRMLALIDGYFASEREPLVRLHREFGVSHLLVEPDKLDSPPRYFRPFQPAINQAQASGKAQGFEVERQFARCSVFRNEKHVLLDLACVASG